MSEKRFGFWVIVFGILLTYDIEYSVESAFSLPHFIPSPPHSLFMFNVVLALTVCTLTVIGNYGINKWFERHTPWDNSPRRRLFLQGLLTIIYCMISVLICVLISYSYFTSAILSIGYLRLIVVLGWTVSILISSSYSVYFYFTQWQRTWRESEELKHENLQSQFDALKNQVNPHFLFNNLNTLSGLISESPIVAIDFVQNLANVYRYVLQSMDKRLVELETELNFLDAYVYLLKMRFQDGLVINTEIPQKAMHYFIAPLTLQILIENAVKHNIISPGRPLQVFITYNEDNSLVIKNNIQRKPQYDTPASTHVGLQNIHKRYSLLSAGSFGDQRQVLIEETASEFLVRIPLMIKEI